jgi:hypothetical protein
VPRFNQTISPTAFGFFDSDPVFQTEADGMVTFVKRKLGDDVLSVELTSRQIWECFEEATLEYARHIFELKIVSELLNALGQATGSINLTNTLPQQTLDFLLRMTDAYSFAAGVGGNFNSVLGFIQLTPGVQDYDLYATMRTLDGSQTVVNSLPSGSVGKLRVLELFHFEPLAAQTFLLNASNITNFLATNFNYESYVNSTVFYVLPVFEDVVRRGMLKEAFRVRRSNYSYQIIGNNIRIYPIPTSNFDVGKMFLRVGVPPNIMLPSFEDNSIFGVSGPNNVPFSILPYGTITQPGRQWIREYTLALAKELLGIIRSKFQTIPIPNADLTLDGESLIAQAREDRDKLMTQLLDFLGKLTNQALIAAQADIANNLQSLLLHMPIPKAVFFG